MHKPNMERSKEMIDDEIREVAERIANKLFEDVVEVVRCKDCKYWDESVYWENDKHEKQSCRCEKNNNTFMTADDFCSRGEKK